MWWAWAGLAAFLLVVVAGYLSPATGAGAQEAYLQHLFGWSERATRLIVVGARKLGHLLGYGFLGVAVTRLLPQPSLRRQFGLAFLVVGAAASTDEWLQSLIPWRSGLLTDVVLDVTAGLLGAGLALARRRTRAREG